MDSFELKNLEFKRLSPQYKFKTFDCGDLDLNEFLFKDSLDHLNQLLAVTYILEFNNEIIAFYSLLNDRISSDEFSGNGWKNIQKEYIHGTAKRSYKTYPAMKIGRLGVSSKYQSKGIGQVILDYVKATFITNNRTGCRYITLDAYNKERSIRFYKNNGFKFFTNKDEKDDTRQMFFNLYPLTNK